MIERDEGRRRLARLKPDEHTALGMRAAGLSYAEIGELRGWTYTKVTDASVRGGRRCAGLWQLSETVARGFTSCMATAVKKLDLEIGELAEVGVRRYRMVGRS